MMTPTWQSLLQQGILAVQKKQAIKALELLHQAHSQQPGSRDVNYWLGNALRLCGKTTEAERTFRQLLTADPADFDSALALAFLFREEGRLGDFNTALQGFVTHPSADSTSLLKIAGLLRDSNQFNSAIEVMQKLVAKEPDQAAHHFKLARMYQGIGQHEAALKGYRATLQLDNTIGGAWLGLAALQKFTDPENPDWQLICSAPEQAAPAEATLCIAFARAKGFDDLGIYRQAWKHYLEGNRLRSLNQYWDAAAWKDFTLQALSQPAKRAKITNPQRRPVFIVGMLRSGTTLLEQLLDQHPRITARGELNFLAYAWKSWNPAQPNSPSISPAAAKELATQIWKHMRLEGPEDGFYIDKNPLNFRYLSMLAGIMPEARLLHLRRDGRDSCLSCFMQLFQHPDTAFSNQLDTLVDYYHDYLQLMRHFCSSLPEQIMTLDYADLVNNTTATVGALLDFLGLPDIASSMGSTEATTDPQRPIRTASVWQARQDVHRRSLGRWQHYYEFAPDFFDRIARLDAEAGQF